MNNGTNSNNNTSFNDSSGRDMDGTARSHSYIPEFQNMAAAVDQFHSHEDNCMSTDIGSAFSQISNLHPQLLTDSFMAEDMPFGDYNDEQQQQQQFDASPVGDPEPESPFQTLEPASGHFPFDTYQDALGYVPIAMKTEVPDGPFAQLQLQQQVLPAQLHDVSSLSRLPDSPSQWEDIQFKFDTQAQMMTLSGGARATGPIAIKQEVGERPLNACAFAAPAAGLDVKQNLRATIRQRRASRGLSHNPTMALSRPQQMKVLYLRSSSSSRVWQHYLQLYILYHARAMSFYGACMAHKAAMRAVATGQHFKSTNVSQIHAARGEKSPCA